MLVTWFYLDLTADFEEAQTAGQYYQKKQISISYTNVTKNVTSGRQHQQLITCY